AHDFESGVCVSFGSPASAAEQVEQSHAAFSFCMRNRSTGVVPPKIPYRSYRPVPRSASKAIRRHASRTGHPSQTRFAYIRSRVSAEKNTWSTISCGILAHAAVMTHRNAGPAFLAGTRTNAHHQQPQP